MEKNEAGHEKLKNCIVCKKEMLSVFVNESLTSNPTQPDGGVSFSGSGEYGSEFDYIPSYDEAITYVVNICDKCLVLAIQANEVLLCSKETTVIHRYQDASIANTSKL